MTLNTFSPKANVAVFGASGGIGGAFVNRLLSDDAIGTVHAFSRKSPAVNRPGLNASHFDLGDEESIAAAVAQATAGGPLDLVIVATGILHRGEELRPEKAMRELDRGSMEEVLRINTLGPTLIAKHCLPQMRRDAKSVFAALSARVGSITDNRLGGWLSYRMSKAALNMALRTLSIEQSRRLPESVVVALHPGTVATDLSAPFSSRVPDGKLFSADRSAGYLLDVIDGLTAPDTGGFFAWDGAAIDY